MTKQRFRDVSSILKSFREFLLGRKHNLHVRFEPLQSPRSIPPADIIRGPDRGYSDLQYHDRSPLRAVKPPVVATSGEKLPGSKGGKPLDPAKICFDCAPAPGIPWGWDSHCYYEEVPDSRDDPKCKPKGCASDSSSECK